jgi:hypothetical protein
MTTARTGKRPGAKSHNSDSKRGEVQPEEEEWDSDGSEDDVEEHKPSGEGAHQPAQPARVESDSDSEEETTDEDEDDDEEEHLVIKTKGSKAAPPIKQTVVDQAANPPPPAEPTRTRSAAETQQPTRLSERSRSRSRNRQSFSTAKARRKGSERRLSTASNAEPGRTGVFSRTKSQIGFDLHDTNGGQRDDDDDEDRSSSDNDRHEIERDQNRTILNDPSRFKDTQGYQTAPNGVFASKQSRKSPEAQSGSQQASQQHEQRSTDSNKKSAPDTMLSPKSVLNLEDDENKPGFPFPVAEGKGPSQQNFSGGVSNRQITGSQRKARSPAASTDAPEGSSEGSDTQTLIGSNASLGRSSTPHMTSASGLPSISQGPVTPNKKSSNPPPNAALNRHVRTRNSHTSLRSLASMRIGPPPHLLTSPGGGKSRVASLSGRSTAIAAPQLNKEEARGSWSTSPTEITNLDSDVTGRPAELARPEGMPRTGSQRSLREYFGLPSASRSGKDGERNLEALRKASFTSANGARMTRASSTAALTTLGASSQGPSRLSAQSVAQAAARLPATSSLTASAYGDQLPESSQVGLISRFLTPSSWNPRNANTQAKQDKNGKSRASTSLGTSNKASVFPESPYAAAHASLVRTLMEDGARTVPILVNGPLSRHRSESGAIPKTTSSFASLTITPAHQEDGHRAKGYKDGRNGKNGVVGDEVVWGLTPFEMSVSRCLNQRKGAVKLSTGGPLGPLSS